MPAVLLRTLPYLTLLLGIVPLAWLGMRAIKGRLWRWMALGFAVSFLSDGIMRGLHPDPQMKALVSQLYPVTQAAIFVLVLSPDKYVEWIIGLLLCVAATSVTMRHAQGLDVLLRTIAWGTISALALCTTGRLRTALLIYFAGGAVTWMGYVAVPALSTWLAYQTTRALGIGLWCAAARRRTA